MTKIYCRGTNSYLKNFIKDRDNPSHLKDFSNTNREDTFGIYTPEEGDLWGDECDYNLIGHITYSAFGLSSKMYSEDKYIQTTTLKNFIDYLFFKKNSEDTVFSQVDKTNKDEVDLLKSLGFSISEELDDSIVFTLNKEIFYMKFPEFSPSTKTVLNPKPEQNIEKSR